MSRQQNIFDHLLIISLSVVSYPTAYPVGLQALIRRINLGSIPSIARFFFKGSESNRVHWVGFVIHNSFLHSRKKEQDSRLRKSTFKSIGIKGEKSLQKLESILTVSDYKKI